MGNTDKTKEELTKEISALRRRVTELRKSEAEHKQAEEALRESENRFHKIADNAADSIWTVDLNMKPTYISPSITLLLGYSIEEAMAKPMEEIFTPASFEVAMKALTEELAIEKIDQKDLLRSRVLELELYRKDGSTVPVETRYSFLRGADTKPVEILAVARDITKRKRMEDALRDSEGKFNAMLQSLSDHLSMMDKDLNIIWANETAKKVFGNGIIGKKCYEVYHQRKEPCEPYPCLTLKAFQDGKVHEHDTQVVDKDGKIMYFHCTANVALRDKEGNPTAVIEISSDITERKQMEESLRESEEFSSSLLSNSPNPILVLNPDASVRYVNPALEKLTGFSSKELVGKKPPYPWWSEETLQKTRRDFEKAIQRGAKRLEELFQKKNEERFWVEITSTPVRSNGEFQYYLANWVDITERKRTEEALRRSEERFRDLFENANDLIQSVTADGHFRYVNKRWREILGYSEEEVANLLLWDIIHPDSIPHCREVFQKVMSGKTVKNIEVVFVAKDGKLVPVEGNVNCRFEEGKPVATRGIFRDITERKQAEEIIRRERDRAEQYLKIAGVMLAAIGADENITMINKRGCEMLGYKERELLGKNWLHLLVPQRIRGEIREVFNKLMAGDVELVEYYENPLLTKDGEERLVAFHNTVLRNPNGEITGVMFSGEDITERKQAEEKAKELRVLKDVDRLRTELLANVSHELRTPLTSIKGFANTLLQPDVKWSEEEQQNFLQAIDQESDRLTRLVNDLLDMSRLEAGAMKLEKDTCHLPGILDSISGRLASLTEHHQLKVMVSSGLPTVYADETRIGQVLTNLVENAAKYSRQGSPITIAAELSGNQVITSVTDEGEGIPAELLDRVFDRFYQAESIAAGRKSGTGLGLSICRGIIKAHGGKIWVESKPGEGSKFSFSLPISKGEEEIAQDSSN